MPSPSSTPGTSRVARDSARGWPEGHAEWLVLGAIVLVGVIARLYRLGLDSFWLDEAASAWFSSRPLAEQWGLIPFYEPHPPLYYTLLWTWSQLFGTGEVALRSLSALASVLTLPVVYGIGRLALPGKDGKVAGLLAALLLALFPTQIAYAQETRVYTLLTLTVAILLLSLLWLIARPQLLNRPFADLMRDPSSGVRLAVLGVILGTSGSFWLHNTTLVLVSPLLLVAAGAVFWRTGFSWQLVRNFVAIGLVILLLWMPNIRWLLSGLEGVTGGFWLQPPLWPDLAWGGDELLGTGGVAYEIPWKFGLTGVNLLLIALGGLAFWRRKQVAPAVLLVAGVVVPVILAIVVSYAITPIFMTRVLLWIEVPAAVLVAASVLLLPSPFLRRSAAAIGVALLAAVLALGWGRRVKEPWNQVASIIAAESTEQDLIIADTAYAQVPMLYYRVPERSPARWLPLPEEYPNPTGESGYPDGFFLREKIDDKTVAQIAAAAGASRKVWYVTRGRTVYDWDQKIPRALRSAKGPGIVRVTSGEAVLLTEYGQGE